MKLLICGGREFNDLKNLREILDKYSISCIIQGGAKGADRLAKDYGELKGIPVITIEANWDIYGRSAGHIRNSWMLKFGQPDRIIAFPGGKGTHSMIIKAQAEKIPVDIIPSI